MVSTSTNMRLILSSEGASGDCVGVEGDGGEPRNPIRFQRQQILPVVRESVAREGARKIS